MIPSMSRPANPYDNASCESFILDSSNIERRIFFWHLEC